MAGTQNSFIKKKKAEAKKKKRQAKFEKRLEKKNQPKSGKLSDMLAYVDEFGNISDEPPEEKTSSKKNNENKPMQ